jgi:serine/threonine/tyrosine protein kinase RAD53
MDDDFSQQLTQTQQTQPYSQGASQQPATSSWPPHLFGVLLPASTTSSSSPSFTSSAPPNAARRLELSRDKREYTVGRHPKADLVLSGPKISSWHAVISLSEDGLVRLQDKSSNGTWVRGSRVRCFFLLFLLFFPSVSTGEMRVKESVASREGQESGN